LLNVEPLLHFSEDPSITRFEPHRAPTAHQDELLVWAMDAAHEPLYWFPRACPRITFWRTGSLPSAILDRLFADSDATRIHAIELGWLQPMRDCKLFVYRFPSDTFEHLDAGHWVSRTSIEPLSVEPVGDLLERHVEAGIELRALARLTRLQDALVELHDRHPGLEPWFSMVRMRNAVTAA
jgi:hypothetical protein